MERLYERECDTFINMLEQSRDDIAETAEVIEEEQMALRSESRMFERERTDMSYYNERQGVSSRASSRASCATPRDPHERPDSSIHSHRRRHRKPVNKLLMRPSSEGSHAYRRRIESPGATSTRSLPTPIVTRTIEEETEVILHNLTTADAKAESERQRQAELMAHKKEEKRKKKDTENQTAFQLLTVATNRDKLVVKDKERQELMVREKLEERKRRKDGRLSPNPMHFFDTSPFTPEPEQRPDMVIMDLEEKLKENIITISDAHPREEAWAISHV